MRFPVVIGLHCHQPVHNFHSVVDEATIKSYNPFLQLALSNSEFHFVLHYSGWLLEYIMNNHKGTFQVLKKLAERGQVEFFTGGYYEPILSAIPSNDRIGQINKLSDLIENNFGQRPTGAWLTERVWDPGIIPDLVKCGIQDLIVDDYHFISAGYSEESLTGYYRTEQDGAAINIFPIDKGLRYKIPFSPVSDVISYIKKMRDKGRKMLVLFDDGEKFGLWPDTYEWVYEKGWLKEFMEAIDNEVDIRTSHFKAIKATTPPSGIAYLPIASYPEMGEWSLFTDAQIKFKELEKYLATTKFKDYVHNFVKGGIWKNFFVKYPESNRIHKRTLELSKRNSALSDDLFQEYLYQSQCNDCLWHGVFGGLYLPNLRNNAWNAIIEAEKRYENLNNIQFPKWTQGDNDLDGYDEIYLRNKDFNMQFISRDGGQLTTIEIKEPAFNLLNTLARRPEGYHQIFFDQAEEIKPEAKDESIATIHDVSLEAPEEFKKHLGYDWYNKNCFIDHIVDYYVPEKFVDGTFRELSDFVNQPFELVLTDSGCIFSRDGGVTNNNVLQEATILKKYSLDKNSLLCEINIDADINGWYVQEHNLHFADISKIMLNDMTYEEGKRFKADTLKIFDPYTNTTIEWKFGDEVDLYTYTVNTVSLAVTEMELTAQGICILAATPMNNTLDFNVTMNIKK